MRDENERSVASDGSVAGKPVAWALQHKNGDMRIGMYFNPADAYEYAEACGDTVVPLYRHPQPTLTDAEREDLREWLAECLRQASIATEGCNEELAERWNERAKRAAAMLERLGGGR